MDRTLNAVGMASLLAQCMSHVDDPELRDSIVEALSDFVKLNDGFVLYGNGRHLSLSVIK